MVQEMAKTSYYVRNGTGVRTHLANMAGDLPIPNALGTPRVLGGAYVTSLIPVMVLMTSNLIIERPTYKRTRNIWTRCNWSKD